jgi:hypothetical protein
MVRGNALRHLGAVAVGALWLAGVSTGWYWMYEYSNGSGAAAAAPREWPAASDLEPASGLPTLLVFAHPQCSCTRATLGELARLMAKAQGRVSATVLVEAPDQAPDSWVRGDLWDTAAAIPGVEVLPDRGGREAALFGSATSGQTLLYDASGTLLFQGGITAARGHAGDNVGSRAVLALVRGDATDRLETPVFGCPLPEFGDTAPRGVL